MPLIALSRIGNGLAVSALVFPSHLAFIKFVIDN